MRLAPIILFVYNRPDHTQKTIEALQKNELAVESELFIYSDAAKSDGDEQAVRKVRTYINSLDGFRKITIIERKQNWGLAKSVIDGVTTIVNKYGKIIVLEDDLVTSHNFLKFMNEALVKYQSESAVFSITGYSHSSDIEHIDDTYFLKLTCSWSWGTWKNKWSHFSHDHEILRICNSKKYSFNFDNSYDYSGMSNLQLNGEIDSWAIFWYASVFLKNGLTLYPKDSLVKNIGFDGSGTHCGISDEEEMNNHSIDYVLTDAILEKRAIRNKLSGTFKKGKNNLRYEKIKNKLQRKFKWVFTKKMEKNNSHR